MPAGTVSERARATRAPCGVSALSGRSQIPTSPPSGSWNGTERSLTKIVPSMTFLYALHLLDSVPGTRRSAPHASFMKPFSW